MALTLSAQSDISEGSMFVYTSDATQFVKSNPYDLDVLWMQSKITLFFTLV